MRYLFYEHGELVAELDKCTVVSAADDAGVSTVLFNGKTYQRRKPVEFVQEWVAFDLVNKWAPSPVIPFDSLPEGTKTAEFWMKECRRWQTTFEELESKYSGVADLYSKSVIRHNETADRYAECRKERMQFQDRLGACSRALGSWLLPDGDIPQSIAKLVEHVSGLPSYHVNDGVGEDSPAMNPSVRYFKGQIADRDEKIKKLESDVERLRNDKIVANGLIANLEGLAAADGEKIRDLESRLETVAASRERSIDDYNKSVAREGRLREQLKVIGIDRDRLLAKVEKYEDGHRPSDGCASEIGRLKSELHEARSACEFVLSHYVLAGKQRDEANKANAALRDEVDAALKERDQWRAEAQGLRKVVNERNEALDEARIDEKRSTDEMCRFQRKLHKIYLITIDADGDK